MRAPKVKPWDTAELSIFAYIFGPSNAGWCPSSCDCWINTQFTIDIKKIYHEPNRWPTFLSQLTTKKCGTTLGESMHRIFLTFTIAFLTDTALSSSLLSHQVYHQVVYHQPRSFATEKHTALLDVLRDHQQTSRAPPTAAHFGGAPPKANDVRMVQLWKPWVHVRCGAITGWVLPYIQGVYRFPRRFHTYLDKHKIMAYNFIYLPSYIHNVNENIGT